MNEIDKIKNEISKAETELIMSGYSDGWWIIHTQEKLVELNNKLKELNDDNNRILDEEK